MSKTILIDIDDTIVSWRDEFLKFSSERGFVTVPEFKNSYYISKRFGINDDEADELIINFNELTTRHFKGLPDALEVLPTLVDNGYRFVGISSCMDTPTIVADRVANLNETFGDIFDDIHCLHFSESKLPYLEKYDSTIWVEDSSNNANLGIQCGHRTFLLDRPWNNHEDIHPHIERVNDWFEIQKYILEGE